MQTEQVISIILTFTLGFAGGFILYLLGAVSFDLTFFSLPSRNETLDFVVVGEQYGSCRSACPQFRVEADGSYRFLFTPNARVGRVIRDGTLPPQIVAAIDKTVTLRALRNQSRPVSVGQGCGQAADGIDVRYRVLIAEDEYLLDSCVTAVDTDSELWQGLGVVWVHLAEVEESVR